MGKKAEGLSGPKQAGLNFGEGGSGCKKSCEKGSNGEFEKRTVPYTNERKGTGKTQGGLGWKLKG